MVGRAIRSIRPHVRLQRLLYYKNCVTEFDFVVTSVTFTYLYKSLHIYMYNLCYKVRDTYTMQNAPLFYLDTLVSVSLDEVISRDWHLNILSTPSATAILHLPVSVWKLATEIFIVVNAFKDRARWFAATLGKL